MIINETSLPAIKQLYPSVTHTLGEDCFNDEGILAEINEANVNSKIAEMETAKANEEQAKADLKASAKAKLISGEKLTEDEANTIVL